MAGYDVARLSKRLCASIPFCQVRRQRVCCRGAAVSRFLCADQGAARQSVDAAGCGAGPVLNERACPARPFTALGCLADVHVEISNFRLGST